MNIPTLREFAGDDNYPYLATALNDMGIRPFSLQQTVTFQMRREPDRQEIKQPPWTVRYCYGDSVIMYKTWDGLWRFANGEIIEL